MNGEFSGDRGDCGAPDGAGRLVFKNSAIHGVGAFAAGHIAAGERVIEYVGERITKAESHRRCEQSNPFIFALDAGYDLDGGVDWNAARFINHSCAPNCEAIQEGERIWIVALKDIPAGEEITFNYGYDLEDFRKHPCSCGSRDCIGYIVAEELFEQVRDH